MQRVLLVDDEVAFLMPMKMLLEQPGMAVDAVESAEQARDLLRTNRYDAVITDVRLGGILSAGGLQVLEYVKQTLPATPVIVMTGYGSTEVRQEANRLQADLFIEKPVSWEQLAAALKSFGLSVRA